MMNSGNYREMMIVNKLTAEELEYVCKRAQEATTLGVGFHEIPELTHYTCEDMPVLLDEIERILLKLERLELSVLNHCHDTSEPYEIVTGAKDHE